MNFEIISEITDIETIAVGTKIRELPRLRRNIVLADGESLKEQRKYVSEAVGYGWLNCIGMKVTELVESK